MPDDPPIPPVIWARLLAFVREQQSGTVTFNVQGGRVRGATFAEAVPAKRAGTPPAPVADRK